MDDEHLADLAALARLLRAEGGAREETRAVLDAVPALVAEVTRLRAVEAAAQAVVAEWGARDEDWYRPAFEDEMDALRAALGV